jgi:hypothetical protein
LNLNLQQRDYVAFSVFLHNKAATTSQHYALCKEYFPNKYVFQRRRMKYVEAGYLTIPPEYRCLHWPHPGRAERITMIGNKAARALRELGYDIPRRDWDHRAKTLRHCSLEHMLLNAEVITCFLLNHKAAPWLRLLAFYPEDDFVDFVTFFDGREEVTLSIQPDALYVTHDLRTGEVLAIAQETHRGSMPQWRSIFKQTSFYKKAVAYSVWWMQGIYRQTFRELLGIEIDNLIVTTVCEKATDRALLLDFLKDVDPKRRGTNLFWLTDKNALDVESPQTLFFDPVWATPAGERGALFENHPVSHPSRWELDKELLLNTTNRDLR